MLVSRDEQSCLVVTYKEIKNCIDAAFGYVFGESFLAAEYGTGSDIYSSDLYRNR